MREILFRGKRIDNGEWANGIPCAEYMIVGFQRVYGDDEVEISKYPEFDYVEIDTETLGEYTGLTDKNGKKIFEGDIVTFNLTADSIGYIRWLDEEAKFAVQYEENDLVDFDSIWGRECEVIGNIHDNPELLEV